MAASQSHVYRIAEVAAADASADLFSGDRGNVIEALIGHRGGRRLSRGRYLFLAGQPAASLFLVRSGVVKTTRATAAGDEVIVRLHGSGEFCGESCLHASRRSEHAVAATASEIVEVPRDDVVACCRARPELALRIMAVLSERLDHSGEQVERLAFEPAQQRLVRTLLDLAESFATDLEPGVAQLDCPLTQGELAQMIATRREVTSGLLNRLRERGLISYARKGRIRIHRARLRAFLGALDGEGERG